jgi:hypothetical protein
MCYANRGIYGVRGLPQSCFFASITVLADVAALAICGVLMTPIAPAILAAVGRYPRLQPGIGLLARLRID